MRKFWQSINWMKAVKIAVGAVFAILLAEILGLENAASAGIITLLTVQNTRRETIAGSGRRLIAFGLMTLLSAPIYAFCGTMPWTFGIVLLLLLLLCFGLHLEDSVPINAVMATHYMAAGGVSLVMLKNELLLLIIGSGIGLLVNWVMPDNMHKIQEKQTQLDEEIRVILRKIAEHLTDMAHEIPFSTDRFARAESLSVSLRREIEFFLQNQTWDQDMYFMRYVNMRREQCGVLQRIYDQLSRLTVLPKQAIPLARLFSEIAEQYHEKNDCQALLAQLDELHASYCRDALPETRESFENRAILYCILTETQSFLKLKQKFYQEMVTETAKGFDKSKKV